MKETTAVQNLKKKKNTENCWKNILWTDETKICLKHTKLY